MEEKMNMKAYFTLKDGVKMMAQYPVTIFTKLLVFFDIIQLQCDLKQPI